MKLKIPNQMVFERMVLLVSLSSLLVCCLTCGDGIGTSYIISNWLSVFCVQVAVRSVSKAKVPALLWVCCRWVE